MAGVTDTQSIRFGHLADVITHVMMRDEADDIAVQLDAADVAQSAALKRPVVWAQRGTALTLPVSTIVTVPWTSEPYDTHGMLDIGTQPARFTAVTGAGAGVYGFQVGCIVDTTGWTRGDIIIYKNGVFVCQKTYYAPQGFNYLQMTAFVNLGVVGDYLSAAFYHEGGGSTDTVTADARVFKVSN